MLERQKHFRVDAPRETIVLEEGWWGLNRGWFCLFTREGKTVEAFGSSRRQAMRLARRFYYKTVRSETVKMFPRVRF